MKRVWLAYGAGVVAGAAAGFLSPCWYLGFLPLSAGLVWAAYDLIDVDDDEEAAE